MIFTAKLKSNSQLYKRWREQRLQYGAVAGVVFKYVFIPNQIDEYVSDELSTEQIAALQHNGSVRLEAVMGVTGRPVVGNMTVEVDKITGSGTKDAESGTASETVHTATDYKADGITVAKVVRPIYPPEAAQSIRVPVPPPRATVPQNGRHKGK